MAELAPQLEAHMDRLLNLRTYDALAAVVASIGTSEMGRTITTILWDHPAVEGGRNG